MSDTNTPTPGTDPTPVVEWDTNRADEPRNHFSPPPLGPCVRYRSPIGLLRLSVRRDQAPSLLVETLTANPDGKVIGGYDVTDTTPIYFDTATLDVEYPDTFTVCRVVQYAISDGTLRPFMVAAATHYLDEQWERVRHAEHVARQGVERANAEHARTLRALDRVADLRHHAAHRDTIDA